MIRLLKYVHFRLSRYVRNNPFSFRTSATGIMTFTAWLSVLDIVLITDRIWPKYEIADTLLYNIIFLISIPVVFCIFILLIKNPGENKEKWEKEPMDKRMERGSVIASYIVVVFILFFFLLIWKR